MREVNLFDLVDDLSKKIENLERKLEVLDVLVEKLDIKLLDFIEEAYEKFAFQCDLDSLND